MDSDTNNPQPGSDAELVKRLQDIISGRTKPTLQDSEVPRMSKEQLKACGMDTPRGYTRISPTGAAPTRKPTKG